MSYILDALRRADAERERGGVPGLHTQALPEPGEDDVSPSPARALRPWHWLAMGLTGGLAVAIAWMALRDETPPPSRASPPQAPAPAASTPALPPPPPLPDEVPAATGPVAIAPMRAAPPAARPPAQPAPAQPAATAAPAAAPSGNATPIRSLAELPADLRAGLPALAFGGSIYSPAAANRLLIVNGQLMHEGDVLAAGVTLEQIKPKAAVLNIRGRRFEIGL